MQIGQRLRAGGERLIARRGNAVFAHQILGENLAALDRRRLCAGAKAGNAQPAQAVCQAQNQRIIGRDDGEIHRIFPRESDGAIQIRGGNARAHRVLRDAAIAGQRINGFHPLIFPQLFDDRVFAAAAAHNEYVHSLFSSRFSDGTGERP